MTKTEFARVLDRMGRLWPQSGLLDASRGDPKTLEVWFDLLAELPLRPVMLAASALARDGERFLPPPGLVYRRAQEFMPHQPELAAPDVLRDPTPEERAIAERWRPRIRQAVAEIAERMTPQEGNT